MTLTPPNPRKHRSRRLQKKLRVGEFQEFGFEFSAEPAAELAPEAQEALIDRFLAEVVEPRDLALGGWLNGGVVTAYGRGSVSEAERAAIGEWLRAQPALHDVRLGELRDVWYGWDND